MPEGAEALAQALRLWERVEKLERDIGLLADRLADNEQWRRCMSESLARELRMLHGFLGVEVKRAPEVTRLEKKCETQA